MMESLIQFYSQPIVRNYLIIGILYMLCMDISVYWGLYKKRPDVVKAYNTIRIQERFFMILLWPYCLFVFIKGLMNSWKWERLNDYYVYSVYMTGATYP